MGDFMALLDQARAALPLRRLMSQFGKAPANERWKSFPKCPFCQQKDCAGTFQGKHAELFKCHHSACPTGGKALDEVGFLQRELNLADSKQGWKEAAIQLMKMANVWREEDRTAPSILANRRRKHAPPTERVDPENLPPRPEPPPETPAAPAPVGEAEAVEPAAEDLAAAAELFEAREPPPEPGAPEAKGDAGEGKLLAVPGITPPAPPVQTPAPADPPPPAPAKSVWERFYELLSAAPDGGLSPEDRAELQAKRGFSAGLIERRGYRTNRRENKVLLEQLAAEFGLGPMLAAGLYKKGDKRERSQRIRPTGQFYGWGVVGKKAAAPDREEQEQDWEDVATDGFEWAQKESGRCNPILIPYRDREGKLIALRPHKGFPKGQPPRLYVSQTVGGGPVMITEGEFKADAVADVLPKWSLAAVPGITMCKNLDVWSELVEWLAAANAKEVVLAYDNEDKSDPRLPGYKADVQKRYEAQVWARVLAARLEAEGYRVSIATLPDEWREGGKADWDSALARLRRAGWSESKIAGEFEQVLLAGIRSWEFKQLKMFDSEVEGIIADRAAWFSYEPGLPWGGKREKRLGGELRELARKLRDAKDKNDEPLHLQGRLLTLATAYEGTWGWYYTFRLTEAGREKLMALRTRTVGAVQLKAVDLLLKGTPHLIAPMLVIPYYVLRKPNDTRDRLVRLRNIRGEDSGLVALPSRNFTAPRDFRDWLSERGNFGWEGGERELQVLQRDINFRLARREVKQLVCYGCERPGQLWFFDDCALGDDGVLVRPDDEGIFWHQRLGYTFRRNEDGVPIGDENQSFRLNSDLPRMHPGQSLRAQAGPAGWEFSLGDDQAEDPAAVVALTEEVTARLVDSFGEMDGWLLMGLFVAMAASPELYRARGEFPGLWIVGEKGSGKTLAAKVAMAMWGYARLDQPMSFKASTTVNAIVTLTQLANIWNWGDEYKEGQLKEEGIRNIVHCGFNREVPGKFSPDGTTRKVRTNFLVTGESTCANAATMDRYVTVVASKEKWQGTQEQKQERFEWLLDHRKYLFTIVRAILARRAEFVAEVTARLAEWERRPELANAEPRGRFGHGVAYGALCGLVKLIPFTTRVQVEAVREWLVGRTMKASREVAQTVNVNQFLADLPVAVKQGAFGDTPGELRKYFRVRENPKAKSPVTEHQLRESYSEHGSPTRFLWRSYYLYLLPGPVTEAMRVWYRKGGRALPLDQLDLRRQMEQRGFWVRPPVYKGDQQSMHKQVFAGKSAETCWCLDVDRIPDLGFCPVDDDVFEASKYHDGEREQGKFIGINEEWPDPRKGDLFYLIDILLRPKKDEGA